MKKILPLCQIFLIKAAYVDISFIIFSMIVMKCTNITDNGSLKNCTGYEILQAVASERPPPVFPLRGRYPECAHGTQDRERESFIWHWKSLNCDQTTNSI